MYYPSKDELSELADQYGITLYDEDREDVEELVQQLLADLDDVDDIPISDYGQEGFARRQWNEPTENPHNAFTVSCEVTAFQNEDGSLDGCSVGVKDIVAVAGIPMSGGSRLLQGYIPSQDATVVKRMLEQGATITAKTNCDELATSGRGTTSYVGPITNPHDETRTAGGSSGGSAVAVATDQVDIAIGTDTSGSVQLPAALCGVLGMKPTHGLVPLSGVVEHAYTMDHVAFFSDTLHEMARVLEATAGKDHRDPATYQAAGRDEYQTGGYLTAINTAPDISSLTIGVVEEGLGNGVTEYTVENAQRAYDDLEEAGATIEPVSIEHFKYARPINENISYTELISHWMARGSPHRRGGIIPEEAQIAFASRSRSLSGELGIYYKSKLLAGAHLIETHQSRYYTRAQAARVVLRSEFETVLDGVDVLSYPTTPGIAPTLEEVATTDLDFAQNTRPATVTQLPAITVPYGTHDGLPLGIQFVGGPFSEALLLGTAHSVRSTWQDQSTVV